MTLDARTRRLTDRIGRGTPRAEAAIPDAPGCRASGCYAATLGRYCAEHAPAITPAEGTPTERTEQ